MIGEFFKSLISPVTETIKGYNQGRTKIKEAKIHAEVAKYEAKAKRWEKTADMESNWDLEAQKQSQYSWKDEFIMLVWFTPFIMLFIPQLQPYAEKGFEALSKVPYGYWLVIFGIVASSFGLRWLFANRVDKAIKSIKKEDS